jgi:hypothetical protein
LDVLHSRKTPIPGPNAFYRQPAEERIAIAWLRLNLKENGIPPRVKGNALIGPLRRRPRGPALHGKDYK